MKHSISKQFLCDTHNAHTWNLHSMQIKDIEKERKKYGSENGNDNTRVVEVVFNCAVKEFIKKKSERMEIFCDPGCHLYAMYIKESKK